jgi:hypothetical protein
MTLPYTGNNTWQDVLIRAQVDSYAAKGKVRTDEMSMTGKEISSIVLTNMHENMLSEAKVVGIVEDIIAHDEFIHFIEEYNNFRLFVMSHHGFGGPITLHIDPITLSYDITPHEIMYFAEVLEGYDYKEFVPIGEVKRHHSKATPQQVFDSEYKHISPAPDEEFRLYIYSDGSVWGADAFDVFMIIGGIKGLIESISRPRPGGFKGKSFPLP